jgi:hypothetical protein
MAEMHPAGKIEPEVLTHLAAAMDTPAIPGPTTVPVNPAMTGEQHWPDGNGSKRHPKERGAGHGRMGHEAAVTAVHRTSRPQMPHSS